MNDYTHIAFKWKRNTLFSWIAIIAVLAFMNVSCKKDTDNGGGGGGGGGLSVRHITDVVPQQYLDSLAKHGMKVYEGTTPPTLDGEFLSQLRYDYNSKDPRHPSLGDTTNAKFLFEKQQGQQISMGYFDPFFEKKEIEDPFITGSGSNFTVLFQVHMFGGMGAFYIFPFEYLISGTLDGDTIRDLKVGTVGLKAKENAAGSSVEGDIKIYTEADGITEKVK